MINIWMKKYMLMPVAHCSSGCMRKGSNQQAVNSKAVDFSPLTLIMKIILYLSLVTASISFTVTETKAFQPVRGWTKSKNRFLGELVSCGYCFGHWIAFALVAIYQPKLFELWWLLDCFLTALVIAWFAAFQWALMCILMEKSGK